MRRAVTPDSLRRFMTELGSRVHHPARIYFTGGATALLHGWRQTTIDLDLKIVSATDAVLRELPHLKVRLEMNIELASPDDFIPALPGWESRSPLIAREGSIDFFHYDFYGQALAKLERSHRRDLDDVESMRASDLIEPEKLLAHFESIKNELYRYPAIDPASFRRTVVEWCAAHG